MQPAKEAGNNCRICNKYYIKRGKIIMNDAIKIVIFSLASVVYLFIISKVLGKKQIAQLEFIDYAVGISIGSIAAEMATDLNENPFWHYLIAMTVVSLFDIAVTLIGRKSAAAKKFLKGEPLAIIEEGEINYKNLKKSKLDVHDLLSLCRDKGYFNIEDIFYAFFETSGSLSVLPLAPKSPLVAEDMQIEKNPAAVLSPLIVDGKFCHDRLEAENKDERWLLEKTKLERKEVKKVLLALYNPDADEITLYYKE